MIGLDPAVAAAYADLADALGTDAPPCWADPDAWYAKDTAPAIRACEQDCHALPECGRLADLLDQPSGVWAGIDREQLYKAHRRGRIAA